MVFLVGLKLKAEALRILKEYYGYDNFREGQEKIFFQAEDGIRDACA